MTSARASTHSALAPRTPVEAIKNCTPSTAIVRIGAFAETHRFPPGWQPGSHISLVSEQLLVARLAVTVQAEGGSGAQLDVASRVVKRRDCGLTDQVILDAGDGAGEVLGPDPASHHLRDPSLPRAEAEHLLPSKFGGLWARWLLQKAPDEAWHHHDLDPDAAIALVPQPLGGRFRQRS